MNRATRDARAICSGATLAESEKYWFGDNKNKSDIETMKDMCASCPVMNECRDNAMVHEAYCNYGGTTRKERQEFRKTTAFQNLLFRAAYEGWLDPRIAVAKYEDIQDALWAAERKKKQEQEAVAARDVLSLKTENPHREILSLSLPESPFDFGADSGPQLELVSNFPETPTLSELLAEDVRQATQTQNLASQHVERGTHLRLLENV